MERPKTYYLTVDDVCEDTGISKPKVQQMFNRPDFPCIDYGAKKLVEYNAYIRFMESGCKQADIIGK